MPCWDRLSALAKICALGAALAAAGCAAKAGPETAGAKSFSFIVIGDAPYSRSDQKMLEKATPVIREGGYPFVIHVGDTKGGGQECLTKFDDRFASLVASLEPVPVFYTPGDNEWTDCDRFDDPKTGKKVSDLARLAIIRERFASGTPEGAERFGYRRQEEQSENASWRDQGVRFMTLHVTGTNNGRDWVAGDDLAEADAAADARDRANLAWLAEGLEAAKAENARVIVIAMQADMTDVGDKPKDVMCEDAAANDNHPCDAFTDLRMAIRDAALAFDGPVLLIHGDTAGFALNQSFVGEEADNLWRLNAAGDAGVSRLGIPYGLRDVTEVTVSGDEAAPFAVRGLLTGARPE